MTTVKMVITQEEFNRNLGLVIHKQNGSALIPFQHLLKKVSGEIEETNTVLVINEIHKRFEAAKELSSNKQHYQFYTYLNEEIGKLYK